MIICVQHKRGSFVLTYFACKSAKRSHTILLLQSDAAAIFKKIWQPCKRNRLKRGQKSLQSNISAVTAKEMERNGQSLTKITELPSVYEADDLLEPPIDEGECNNYKTVSMTSAV